MKKGIGYIILFTNYKWLSETCWCAIFTLCMCWYGLWSILIHTSISVYISIILIVKYINLSLNHTHTHIPANSIKKLIKIIIIDYKLQNLLVVTLKICKCKQNNIKNYEVNINHFFVYQIIISSKEIHVWIVQGMLKERISSVQKWKKSKRKY